MPYITDIDAVQRKALNTEYSLLGWERRDPTRSGIKGNQAFKCANHNDPRLTGLKVGAVPTPSTKQERAAMTQHLL